MSAIDDVFDGIAAVAREIPGSAPPSPILWARDFTAMLDIEYVVDGLIASQEIVAIYGAPKCGKTFVATHLAGCVTTGREFLGMQTTKGAVLYVAAEMGLRAQRRGFAWMQHYLGELESRDLPFGMLPYVVNLLDADSVDGLRKRLHEVFAERGPVMVLIIDTLARSIPGGDENLAKDIGTAVGVATRLRDEFKCAVAFVHHTGKDATKGMRGSSALLGAVDLSLFVEKDDAGSHRITVVEARDILDGGVFGFRLPVVELGSTRRGVPISSCYVEPCAAPPTPAGNNRSREPSGPNQQIVLRVLRDVIATSGEAVPATSAIPAGTRWVAESLVVDRAVSSLPGERAGYRAREAVRRALTVLVAGGWIGVLNGHIWVYR